MPVWNSCAPPTWPSDRAIASRPSRHDASRTRRGRTRSACAGASRSRRAAGTAGSAAARRVPPATITSDRKKTSPASSAEQHRRQRQRQPVRAAPTRTTTARRRSTAPVPVMNAFGVDDAERLEVEQQRGAEQRGARRPRDRGRRSTGSAGPSRPCDVGSGGGSNGGMAGRGLHRSSVMASALSAASVQAGSPQAGSGSDSRRRHRASGLRQEDAAAARSGPSARRRRLRDGFGASSRRLALATLHMPQREQHDEDDDDPEDDLAHGRLQKILPGFMMPARIERALDRAHQLELDRALVADELVALQLADAVLGAEAAAVRAPRGRGRSGWRRRRCAMKRVGRDALGRRRGCSAGCRRPGARTTTKRTPGSAARERALARRRGTAGSPTPAARCRA